jgi:uncharacterized membrane protein YqaE (UPF0057 family)
MEAREWAIGPKYEVQQADEKNPVPPLGVYAVAGCGVDLLINILLTILGYIPGHIHAFYIEFVYYERREQAREVFTLSPPQNFAE